MKRFRPRGLSILLVLLLQTPCAWGWGDEGHRIVIEAAVRLLPEPVRSFYAAHLPFLLEHTSDPDEWSVIDPDEARRHYLDLELLGPKAGEKGKVKQAGSGPLAYLPTTREEALARYGAETLKQAGMVPWTIVDFSERLSRSMADGDWEDSALLAAALSHYAADACMPLHTTVNYKGQLTGNLILDDRTEHRHVHLRFEVAMLRQFRAEIKSRVLDVGSPASAVAHPFALARQLLQESHSLIDPILEADRDLTAQFGLDEADPDRVRFTRDYYAALYERTGTVAVEQLARAASATASLWLSAWQAAGSPALPDEQVAFGEQVVLTERGLGGTATRRRGSASEVRRADPLAGGRDDSPIKRRLPRRTLTKVFLHDGSPYVLVTADWPKAGRFSAGNRLTDEQYQGLWQELGAADVWDLADAMHLVTPPGPTVTVTVARHGREHHLNVYAPEARPDTRYGRIYRTIRSLGPETPAPAQKP